jgi:hypothetical protein
METFSTDRTRLIEIDPIAGTGRTLREASDTMQTVLAAGDRIVLQRATFQSDVLVGRISPDARRWLTPLERLTNSEADDFVIGWSNGDVVFTSNRDGALGVFAQKPHEPDARRLVAGDSESVLVSTSVARDVVVYSRSALPDAGANWCKTYALGVDGASRELTTSARADGFFWCGAEVRCASRASKCVAASTRQSPGGFASTAWPLDTPALAVPDSARAVDLPATPFGFALTPDGRAAVERSGTNRVLYTSLEDGTSKELTVAADDMTELQYVDFAPDGSTLVFAGFTHSGTYGYAIGGVDTKGHAWSLTPDAMTWFSRLEVAPDGMLAVSALVNDSDLWLLTRR